MRLILSRDADVWPNFSFLYLYKNDELLVQVRVRPSECFQKGISKLASNTKPDSQSLLLFRDPVAGSNTEKHHLAETKVVLYYSNIL